MKSLKKKNKKSFLTFVCIIFCFISCNEKKQSSPHHPDDSSAQYPVSTKHAEGFRIEHFDDYTRVAILNPWATGQTYAVYNLYKDTPAHLPAEGINIHIPLKSLVVNTFSYFEFLQQLGELDKITGTSDGFRVYHPKILERLKSGKISDLGDPFKMNIEITLTLKPEAILTSAYAQRDSYSERVADAGFPVIYNLEWMENSPLARAEWIKMIAAFFDKEALADSLFNGIEQRYLAVKERAKHIQENHTVMAGDNFQGTWYVPGGNSYNAILFGDAQLDYYYKNNHENGSIGLDIETVLTQFGKAEYWFGSTAASYKELAAKDPKYMLLKSVKDKHVYNNNNRTTPSGGNDYFESAIANPDLILKDLLKAAYPELLPSYTFSYIQALL